MVKRLWGFSKVRRRSLAKDATRSFLAQGWSTSIWHGDSSMQDSLLSGAIRRGPSLRSGD